MQGEDKFPDKYQLFQSTWKQEQNFTYEFWDEFRIEQLIKESKNINWQRIYDTCSSLIEKIDFSKYIIIWTYGGIYIDMDIFSVNAISPDSGMYLENFINNIEKCGHTAAFFPHNGTNFTIFINKLLGLHGNIIINNAVIVSSCKNEYIECIIRDCEKALNYWKSKWWFFLRSKCLVTTGPIMFSNSIQQFNEWNKMVHDVNIFEPYTSLQLAKLTDRWDCVNDCMKKLVISTDITNTIGVHVLDLSWLRGKKTKRTWESRIRHVIYKYFVI
jgi:mannosyltransferase OCH1-like enzyme